MTAKEIEMLMCGIGIGAQSMALWRMVLDMRDARRDLAMSCQARRQAAGAAFLSSLRVYQLQQRHGAAW